MFLDRVHHFSNRSFTGVIPTPKTIDAEYESFLAEIGEKKPEPVQQQPPQQPPAAEEGADAEKSYEEFMAAINEGT